MQNFVKENIYVKIFDGVPKLMILLTEGIYLLLVT